MTSSARAPHRPLGRKGWALAALIATASASVVLSLNAWGAARERHALSGGDACAHVMGEGHHGMMGGMPFDARHIEKLLDQVNATDAQRAQIRVIGDKARTDLKALHPQMPGAGPAASGTKPGDKPPMAGPEGGPMGGLMALLTQPKVDAVAAEKTRQQMLAQHDAVSKRMLQAAIDIAQVLTPDQRVALGKLMQAHREHHGDHPQEHAGHGQRGDDHPMEAK